MSEKNIKPVASQVPARLENMMALAERIDLIAEGAVEVFKTAGSFKAELVVANATQQLRESLTLEVMAPVMELMNTDLGFRTDRDPKTQRGQDGRPVTPYAVEVVRDCVIEAKLRGFHVVGNEFNIISARFYAAKNGLRRKVSTYPGLTDFKDLYDVPRNVGDKGAIVKCRATWKKNGVVDSIECEIPVKVNSFMGSDAVLGKAERKLLKRVFDRLTGISTPEGEVGEESVVDVRAEAAPQPFQTATGNSGQPPVEPPNAPTQAPAEPEETPQIRLEKLVTEAGHTFAQFQSWAVKTGMLPAAKKGTGFADLSDADSRRMVNAKEGLLSNLARMFPKGGGQ